MRVVPNGVLRTTIPGCWSTTDPATNASRPRGRDLVGGPDQSRAGGWSSCDVIASAPDPRQLVKPPGAEVR